MAKTRKRGQYWYARVRIWEKESQREREVSIPLDTKSKAVMLERLKVVNEVEMFIKDGTITDVQKYFPWLNDGKSEFIRFTVRQGADEWLSKRRVRPNTLDINRNSLDHFVRLIGEKFSLESITFNTIEKFREGLEQAGLSNTTINIHLRTVKTMLRYFQERDMIDKVPVIKQLPIDDSDPIYISDDEFQSIIELEWLDGFFKRAFYFYRDTGCRLNEPFMGTVSNNWLKIPNTSKGKKARKIPLSDNLIEIYKELRGWNESRKEITNHAKHLSKQFKKALRAIGADESKHFHSLRHTFAVRCILKGIPYYWIQKVMGHRSITTTEVYSEMDLSEVKDDFPTLVEYYQNDPSTQFRDMRIRDIDQFNSLFLDGRVVN